VLDWLKISAMSGISELEHVFKLAPMIGHELLGRFRCLVEPAFAMVAELGLCGS
jgi:hypothetical protein